MRSFSLATLLLTSSGSVSAAILPKECFASSSKSIASLSDCGHHGSLSYCLSHLINDDLVPCYVNAGCSELEAKVEAQHALDQCQRLAEGGDLRRRFHAVVEQRDDTPPRTAAPALGAAQPAATGVFDLFRRTAFTGDAACLATSTVDTSTCPLTTVNNLISTLSCFPTQVAQSECSAGYTCSVNDNGAQVCMVLINNLDTLELVISIIFGFLVTLGVATMIFLCVKDSRLQKRLTAKAEATALARAATKKKKADEMRSQKAPLMSQQDGAASDPFADRSMP